MLNIIIYHMLTFASDIVCIWKECKLVDLVIIVSIYVLIILIYSITVFFFYKNV